RVPPRIGPVIRSGGVFWEHEPTAAEQPAKPEPKMTNLSKRRETTGWKVLLSFATGWRVLLSMNAVGGEIIVFTFEGEVSEVFVKLITSGFASWRTEGCVVNIVRREIDVVSALEAQIGRIVLLPANMH
ncbi:MAG: hypothetical protein ACTS5F_01955, partial [Candidatus Hodgkinia cicadicola]